VCKSAKTPQFANSEKTANYQITHFPNPSLYHIIKMRPTKDLESVREQIIYLFNTGLTYQQILTQINNILLAQEQQSISIRTLKTTLTSWGLSRQQFRVNLDPLYKEISSLFLENKPELEILAYVNSYLQQQSKPTISLRTLKSTFTKWNLQRQTHTQVSDDIIERVRRYFFHYGYSDTSIQRDLQRDGYAISPWAIRTIRWQNNMKRRLRTSEEREEALQTAITFLENDLQQSAAVRGFGRGYLYNYVRFKGQVLVAQNRLYDFYRTILPEEVEKRREGNFKHRTDFKVPGPNFLWCLDGYEKLKRFGIQVYACIDAYSRCIIWFYIGRSATTSISTLKQYLRTIQQLQMRPFFTRSDHGIETPLWVAAQATLAKAGPASITYEDQDGIQHHYHQGDRITSCHIYGPSTRNVRIESWWRQLRQGASDRWIVSKECIVQSLHQLIKQSYFNELAEYALFIEDNLTDQIALYAIYGPMIKDEFADFIDLWNSHKIRTQKNRQHVISGQPIDLYNRRDVRNWGVTISEDEDAADNQALRTMLEPLQDIDLDSFLSTETEAWCTEQLSQIGLYDMNLDNHQRPYITVYLQLRVRIREHQESGQLPVLQLTPKPQGGIQEYVW
jgi:hypothetical protein